MVMKTLIVLSAALAFIMMNTYAQEDESKVEEHKISTLEVYSIHELEIKPGVDIKEFENFVIANIAPIYNKMKGQKLFLVKGDRGVRKDKYAIILTFDEVNDRDRIYPSSGEFVGDFGDDSVWEKFRSMVKGLDGTKHTDYVKVVQ
jgi:hypothetical protein